MARSGPIRWVVVMSATDSKADILINYQTRRDRRDLALDFGPAAGSGCERSIVTRVRIDNFSHLARQAPPFLRRQDTGVVESSPRVSRTPPLVPAILLAPDSRVWCSSATTPMAARRSPRARLRLAKVPAAREARAEVVHKIARLSETPILVWPRRISHQTRKH